MEATLLYHYKCKFPHILQVQVKNSFKRVKRCVVDLIWFYWVTLNWFSVINLMAFTMSLTLSWMWKSVTPYVWNPIRDITSKSDCNDHLTNVFWSFLCLLPMLELPITNISHSLQKRGRAETVRQRVFFKQPKQIWHIMCLCIKSRHWGTLPIYM